MADASTPLPGPAYLAAIVDSADDAIISKNLSGIIQTWNKSAERIFGYTAKEAIGQPMLLIIPPALHNEEKTILARLGRGERIDHYETLQRRKDGRLIDVSLTVSPVRDAHGAIIGASKIARDITEQKQAQRALHESEERWRVTLESIGDAVVATDAAGVVTFANAVAVELLGRPKTEIIGRPLAEGFKIVNEQTRRAVDNPVARVSREGFVVGLANHTVILRSDGTEVPIDDSAAPIRDHEGRLAGVVFVFRDISEKKQSQSQLQLWNAELEARVRERTREVVYSQERLRALASQLNLTEQRERRRLAANLHDYLAQLLALARMKLGQSTQRLNEDPAGVKSALKELDDLLDQSLDYTRTLMAQLSPAALHDLGIIPALHWLAEKMVQQALKVDVLVLTEERPHFSDNQSDLLFQAVRELLTNVARHAGVQTAVVSVDKQDRNTWLITVQDRGVGFDVGSVHYNPSGEHFGLFSIQERMEAMSGWCRIDSTPGQGTKVELGLPITPPAVKPTPHLPAAITRVPEKRRAKRHSRWKVLLVDDHAMVRQGLRSILETYPDLEVIAEAADGLEAVDYASRERPDVVVMDINLPRLNGIDATRRIKKEAPHTLVIGLSVQYSSQTLKAVLEAGGASLLSKEEATEDLYRTIIRFLDGSVNE
jgi:PAS domain S-box-containing protein